MTRFEVRGQATHRERDGAVAGQNRSGVHCTTSLSSHSNLPVIAGALMSTARSAACRLVMGALNVTITGCATPTTWPRVRATDPMVNRHDRFAAARLTPAGPATTGAAIRITAKGDLKTGSTRAREQFDQALVTFRLQAERRSTDNQWMRALPPRPISRTLPVMTPGSVTRYSTPRLTSSGCSQG